MSKYDIKGRIFLTDAVDNKQHKFGENSGYINVIVVGKYGTETTGMLTWHDIAQAITRAQKNPEDLPLKKSCWAWFWNLVGGWK